jgi:hypothetical protein
MYILPDVWVRVKRKCRQGNLAGELAIWKLHALPPNQPAVSTDGKRQSPTQEFASCRRIESVHNIQRDA